MAWDERPRPDDPARGEASSQEIDMKGELMKRESFNTQLVTVGRIDIPPHVRKGAEFGPGTHLDVDVHGEGHTCKFRGYITKQWQIAIPKKVSTRFDGFNPGKDVLVVFPEYEGEWDDERAEEEAQEWIDGLIEESD